MSIVLSSLVGRIADLVVDQEFQDWSRANCKSHSGFTAFYDELAVKSGDKSADTPKLIAWKNLIERERRTGESPTAGMVAEFAEHIVDFFSSAPIEVGELQLLLLGADSNSAQGLSETFPTVAAGLRGAMESQKERIVQQIHGFKLGEANVVQAVCSLNCYIADAEALRRLTRLLASIEDIETPRGKQTGADDRARQD